MEFIFYEPGDLFIFLFENRTGNIDQLTTWFQIRDKIADYFFLQCRILFYFLCVKKNKLLRGPAPGTAARAGNIGDNKIEWCPGSYRGVSRKRRVPTQRSWPGC